MEIYERQEMEVTPEGASVTESPKALYFYFRQKEDLWRVRLSKSDPPDAEIEVQHVSKHD